MKKIDIFPGTMMFIAGMMTGIVLMVLVMDATGFFNLA
jgi:hypothetical protein